MDEFRKIGTEIVGISVDSKYSHLAWINTPRKEGGLGGINFPLVADLTKSICRDYDVLMDSGHSLRGLFVIDKKGILRQITKNDPPVGRSVDETLRLMHALQFTDQHGDQVCPINWKPGDATINVSNKNEYFGKTYK